MFIPLSIAKIVLVMCASALAKLNAVAFKCPMYYNLKKKKKATSFGTVSLIISVAY